MQAVRLPFEWFHQRTGQAMRASVGGTEALLRLSLCLRIPPPWPGFDGDCYQLVFDADRPLPQGWYELLDDDGQTARLMLAPGPQQTMHTTVM